MHRSLGNMARASHYLGITIPSYTPDDYDTVGISIPMVKKKILQFINMSLKILISYSPNKPSLPKKKKRTIHLF